MASSSYHPLTNLLLLDTSDDKKKKYQHAVLSLDRCAQSLSSTGISKNLEIAIRNASVENAELCKDLVGKRIFLSCLEKSALELKESADPIIHHDAKNLYAYLLTSNDSSQRLMQLMGVQIPKPDLNPRTVHILQLLMGEKIKEMMNLYTIYNPTRMTTLQIDVRNKVLKIFDLLNHCSKVLDKNTNKAMSNEKKKLAILHDKTRVLMKQHQLQYFTLKKHQIEICQKMLGPQGPENMQMILAKLKHEHEEKVKSNEEKKKRLELFEGLGAEYKILAEKYAELEKKIKYTKMSLNQMESMFK
ncbi:uncharacterized protein LOC132205786 [Neocloeon triangulifer]|uniref:uncharacterized protein LOC132205786 n=1 Tax=Neocloeon triangulifer TaxID=2078957 RepID=UPI00286EC3C3|nr:uncharacterized protein LOC132205786 [Neocloeon triangulifer]